MTDTDLAARIREILAGRDPKDPFITYQALVNQPDLQPLGTIQYVAAALEPTMREDVAAGVPMVASLVISRAEDMPRRGFFDLAVALGRFPDESSRHRAAWQAECVAVTRV